MSVFLTFIKGYGISSGLIMAIGAQNAFVLKKGITKSHVFVVAILCSIIDALMITLGASGLGAIIANNVYLLDIARYGGAAFLFCYGTKSFYSSFFLTRSIEDVISDSSNNLKATIITILAVSFLNPHLYLDTVVLLGSIGAQIVEHERAYFTIGAICASCLWFFALAYGAGYLSPLFQKPISWKILDGFIGVVMWSIAVSLIME